MPKPTGPTNPLLRNTIAELRNKGYKEKIKFLITIADLLQKPRRKRIEVSLSKLNRVCKNNENVVVPGKVLSGILEKPLIVYAWSFSETAKNKIENAGGKVFSITELIQKNPHGSNVRIVC